jgi:cell division septation protein DedD
MHGERVEDIRVVVVVVAAEVVVVGAVVVVVVAAAVVVDTLVVDDDDTAADSAVASPLDSDDPLHAERTTRATNTGQSTQRMRHLPMLIFPHRHCLPSVKRSQHNAAGERP